MSSSSKIVFLIDQIDEFVDPSLNTPCNLAFWIPKKLPSKVRLIASCSKESAALQYFLKTGCYILELKPDPHLIESRLESYKEPVASLSSHGTRIFQIYGLLPQNLKSDCEFMQIYFECLVPGLRREEKNEDRAEREGKEFENFFVEADYNKLQEIKSNEELIRFIVEFYENKLMPAEKYKRLLLILCSTFKGLLYSEIQHLVLAKF